eukprot:2073839-Rhodomonas_salina.5
MSSVRERTHGFAESLELLCERCDEALLIALHEVVVGLGATRTFLGYVCFRVRNLLRRFLGAGEGRRGKSCRG